MNDNANNVPDKIRADKWLWAARFFRTRSLAKEAIGAGKVHMQGAKIKVSKELRVGDILVVRQGSGERSQEKTVVVKALSAERKNAAAAALLYEETAESQARRVALQAERQSGRGVDTSQKPNKKQRRALQKLKTHF